LQDSACFEDFEAFAGVLEMLRKAIVDEDGKRWTSRFLFPFGKHSVYEDFGIKPGSGQLDRNYIYFGHTGEVLYLMICRSSYREELLKCFEKEFFKREDACDILVKRLQDTVDKGASGGGRRGGYLPYQYHDVYDDLGKDWQSVWALKGMPWKDRLTHLVFLGALHLMRYQMLISAEILQCPTPTMVCEAVGPRTLPLRRLSVRSLEQNKDLSTRALDVYLDEIEKSECWQRALDRPEALKAAREILREIVGWNPKNETFRNPEDLLERFREAAQKRHGDRSADLHRQYGQKIGLVSRYATNQYRYAPNDSFLRTLVVANVTEPQEFGDFLHTLWDRYGLIIGHKEADQALEQQDFDREIFRENARRLEDRLRRLGLIHRLSDACAYVRNPFFDQDSPRQPSGMAVAGAHS